MTDGSSPAASVLQITDGDRLAADVVVVGSGAGGAAVAGELSRLGADVVMIEAGELDAEIPLGSHVHTAFPNEAQLESDYGPVVWSRLGPYQGAAAPIPGLLGAAAIHGVGGLLSFWSHMCTRPDGATEAEPSIPLGELDRLWDDAATLLWANLSIEADGVRQQRIQGILDEAYPGLPAGRGVQQLPTAMRRIPAGGIEWAGIGALLDPLSSVSPGTIRILVGTPARRIERLGSRAVAVVAATGRGQVRVQADAVVSAGGAIGAAQLLHASRIRPPALGRYLTDHTMVTSRIRLRDDIVRDVPEDDPTFSVWLPSSTARPVHTQVARGWVSAAPFVGDLDQRTTADIGQFTGVNPDPDNRLRFDDDAEDTWGMPRVSGRLKLGAADRERVRFAFADHATIAAELGDPDFGVAISLAPPGTSLHLMGTTRIGDDPSVTTADPFGRVWGTDNVYVAGNGVSSTLNHGNPTLNTVALALRTARRIAGAV